jgi:hypothetical protein
LGLIVTRNLSSRRENLSRNQAKGSGHLRLYPRGHATEAKIGGAAS